MKVSLENIPAAISAIQEAFLGYSQPITISACRGCQAPIVQLTTCGQCGHNSVTALGNIFEDFKKRPEANDRDGFIDAVNEDGGSGTWILQHYKDTYAYKHESPEYDDLRAGVDAMIDAAETVSWPEASDFWDHFQSKGVQMPEYGFLTERDKRRETLAIEMFGAACVEELKSAHENRDAWLSDSKEGREMNREFAKRELELLGLSQLIEPKTSSPKM